LRKTFGQLTMLGLCPPRRGRVSGARHDRRVADCAGLLGAKPPCGTARRISHSRLRRPPGRAQDL